MRPDPYARTPRGLFANRTLNLRSIRAVGYDMDYTLVHYRVREWESMAFEYAKARLADQDWPVQDLTFDASTVTRGLAIDRDDALAAILGLVTTGPVRARPRTDRAGRAERRTGLEVDGLGRRCALWTGWAR